MSIQASELELKWKIVNYFDGGYVKLDIDHPLEWYLGYQSINRKTLLILLSHEIKAPCSSKSIIVAVRRRESDGRWTLSFELMKDEQEDVFFNFCSDLIHCSQTAASAAASVDLVCERYKQWNKLLEFQKKSLMDESNKRGFIGELLFLKRQLQQNVPPLTAVQSWVGPDGADQDFVCADCWYEIKTIGVSSDAVLISSLQQLDVKQPGKLVVFRIDPCAPEKVSGFSIAGLVTEIRKMITSDLDTVSLFDMKTTRYGYIDLPDYLEQKYFNSGVAYYLVDSSFPKLSREFTPSQVLNCQYSLSVAGLCNWLIREK